MTDQTHSHFSEFFSGLAWKFLADIDLPRRVSNQHEIQGISTFRELLGSESRSVHRVLWRVFDDAGDVVLETEDDLTWYNARENNPARSAEWRFYYRGETPLQSARAGDLLLATKMTGGLEKRNGVDIVLYVIPQESRLFQNLLWLLGISLLGNRRERNLQSSARRNTSYLEQDVLEQLDPDLNASLIGAGHLIGQSIYRAFSDYLANPVYDKFPSTQELAEFGHNHLDVDPRLDPDAAIERVLELETAAFQALERAAVQRVLETQSHILTDVDAFVSFGLRVQNRRKSRRGISLERHLAFIFERRGLPFEEQVATEERSTVDFLFPGHHNYIALSAPIKRGVVALAAKTTLKERWRQVLAEATKMERRHLFTLETSISSAQTAEMGRSQLSLVVPASAIDSYFDPGTEILTLRWFCDYVQAEVG